MNVSYRRASLAESQRDTSKSFTSPAIRDGKVEASKRVMGPIPERPATMFSQAGATPMPTGDTMPRPVTTTRRRDIRLPEVETDAAGAAGGCERCRGRDRGPPTRPAARRYFLTWLLT